MLYKQEIYTGCQAPLTLLLVCR